MKKAKLPLVAVFAHPDDEAFGPGGSLAHFAREREVIIICVTSGNTDARFRQNEVENLENVRKQELLHSAQILGVSRVEFLGFQDGGLCNNLYHEIAQKIQDKVNLYKPDTLLTFEPRGVSGHIDHVAVSLITSYVFQHSGFVKELYYYCELDDFVKTIPEYFIYFPPGYEKKDIDKTIKTKDVWEQKKQSMRAHVSQQKDAEHIIELQSQFPKEENFLIQSK